MSSAYDEPSDVTATVVAQSLRILDVYRADPGHVAEHANNERRITQGGYGERQIWELVQNGADENQENAEGGVVHVLLTDTHLYCANTGHPVTPEGADTILRMAVSKKRGGQIGRFGVGFKSVLSVCDTPRLYSVSGSFGFDRSWSAARIREVLPGLPEAEETPVLRMAQPLDLATDRRHDPVLDELMGWASTVVVLPLRHEAVRRLGEDLRVFPQHFLLFSAHVSSVVLEDRRTSHTMRRVLSQRSKDTRHEITEERDGVEGKPEAWDVFHVDHEPSPEAMRTAGELHGRPVIRLSWAVPRRGTAARGRRGNFWAFFPTHYDTTLTGYLNAPWKTPEDRQNLTKSDFNAELVRVAAELVVGCLPRLVDRDDPGDCLTLLTARGREASQWGDRMLSEQVIEVASRRPSLPDQTGTLRDPRTLRLHPGELRTKWLELWASHPGRPVNWVHHSVERQQERRSRVRDIQSAVSVHPATVIEWLEALVAERSPAASALAVRIVAEMRLDGSKLAEAAAGARVLLTERGDLVPPAPGAAYRRSLVAGTGLRDDIVYVHPEVGEAPDARRALEVLGVQEADPAGRLKAVLDLGFTGYGTADWEEFWELLRSVGGGRGSAAVREKIDDPRRAVRVRTVDGVFRPIRDTFLGGPVVPADGSRDRELLIDPVRHAADTALLRELGAIDRPVAEWDPRADPWFEEYRGKAYVRYLKSLPETARRPNRSSVHLDGASPAGPLHLLPRLSEEGRAAFLAHLPPHGLVENWTQQVGVNRNSRQPVPSPLVWMAHQTGVVPTSMGVRKPRLCVSAELGGAPELLPVAALPPDTARVLGLPATADKVHPDVWSELLDRAHVSVDAEFVGAAYALLTGFGKETEIPWPEDGTRCQIGEEWTTRPDEEIGVTADRQVHTAMRRAKVPVLLVPDRADAEHMIEEWGFSAPSDLMSEELETVVLDDPVELTDLYPRLRQRLPRGITWRLAHCSYLARVTRTPDGRHEDPLTEAVRGDTVLLRGPDDESEVLLAVDRVLRLGLGPAGCADLLERQRKDLEDQRLVRVRQEPDPARKLLLAVGPELLREALPPGLLQADEELTGAKPDDLRTAQLTVAAHGEEVLRVLAPALVEQGFDAPHQWTGKAPARTFVRTYGFPAEWAGDQDAERSVASFETVAGPRKPRPLHTYQMRLVANMYQHLVQGTEKRAMLQLPTGAGKTRIAVEAIVQALADGVLKGPVLWIAQSAELCEQAIETWKFVWSQVGPDTALGVSRMWGGMRAEPFTDGPQVVVAIDDTLRGHLHTEPFAWLREAGLVVVDEAHFAVPRTYTKLLDSLGVSHNRTERHLVGLTATAFRGSGEEETRRLAARFGHKRLDRDVFGDEDPYTHLQRIGVLSRVEQRELSGGSYTLTPSQIAEVEKSNSMTLPSDVVDRLVDDVSRTRRIVEEIERLPADWPVLVFGTSVQHAQVLAALLNERGIAAASVDSKTPTGVRNRRVEAFRSGYVRVLTNYNVLTQGFDAPAVRAVVVARPTYSPNTYIQMIGRGLRGPLNGGKESCLILNVRDNILNFGRELAWTDLEYLWEGPA
ncbi:sacsin N-terminal ATP-binding-like domain-containing protein [Streptomyces sp. MS19]|uniref:sacsin N-terminal ATP-binding-like domain-containing protein n=1 Tax=Streptomyces sp. MS19 TaxID=3385972 RepID=UPI0039A22F81